MMANWRLFWSSHKVFSWVALPAQEFWRRPSLPSAAPAWLAALRSQMARFMRSRTQLQMRRHSNSSRPKHRAEMRPLPQMGTGANRNSRK
jgi:hypothetical protein